MNTNKILSMSKTLRSNFVRVLQMIIGDVNLVSAISRSLVNNEEV